MLITITNIKLKTIVGAWAWEKKQKQPVIINCFIEYGTGKALKSDSIKDALDYYELTKEITSKVKAKDFELLEKLTDFILQIILTKDKVKWAKVEVQKPKALRPFAKTVSITAEGKK
jgi:D-erythro-7,8-dihydroneopterin triphosphate epimerase